MKITLADFEVKLVGFAREIVSTFPTKTQKFVGGAAIPFAIAKLETYLAPMCNDGVLDTDQIKSALNSGIESVGDRIEIDVFDLVRSFSPAIAPIFTGLKTTLTTADIARLV